MSALPVRLTTALRQLIAVGIASLWAPATIAAPPAADDAVSDVQLVTKIRLAGDRIEYSGLITTEANAAVFELYESTQPRPTGLVIESSGGSAGAGMQLGSWMIVKGLDVEVDTFCFSSCANYVFLAGRTKVLAPRASLMWHGGVTQPITKAQFGQLLDYTLEDLDEADRRTLLERHPREELLQQLELARQDLVVRETRFFQVIGIDQRITSLGHLYERQLLQGKGDYMGWDYSLEDLRRLGVRGVRVKGEESWDPVFPIRGRELYRIRLDELAGFEPRIPPLLTRVPRRPSPELSL